MFTYLFLGFFLLDLFTRFWLAQRQIHHVMLHRGTVPEEFSSRISLRSHQRAADYTIAKVKLNQYERLVDAVVLICLTLMGGLQQLDLFWARHIDHEIWRQIALILSVAGLLGLISMPFNVWKKFRLEARFGFNRLTPALFVRDTLIGSVLGMVLLSICAGAILLFMEKTGEQWPLWAWLFWVGFNLFLIWAYPTFIAPLFNSFKPLERDSLRERINALAERCQFKLNGLYVMDGSKRSAHGNAYFTGLGNNKRIVFFDTLLNKLDDEEIEAVLAHELGHFKHHHIRQRLIFNFLGSLLVFLLLGWLSQKAWFYVDLGVIPQLGRANDGMALVLFFLCLPVFTFWITPLINLSSRKHEYQADAFAAAQCPSIHLRHALLKLYNDNAATLTPDPLHSAFYDTHPSALSRLQHLERYENQQSI